MKKYPKYKASGVDWLGEIPNDWDAIKIKFTDTLIMGQSPESKDVTDFEKGLPFLQGNAEFTETHPIPKNWCEKANKLAVKDDLLLSVRAPVGALNVSDQTYGIGRGLCAIRANKNNLRFLYYILSVSKEELNKVSTGTTFVAITIPNLSNVIIPKVNLPEQHTIVRFLDYKTGQIDSFITNRQKQIELLKEQKQFVLDKRITEGIYPEKGFQKIVHPYIKRIPVGWEFKKLAFLSKITRLAGYEYTLLWEPQEDGEVIALRGQNVGFNELKDIENAERISKELSLRLNRSKLFKGDIVFPCVGTVGKAVLIEEDNKYHINQNIAKISPKNEVDGLFLSLLLNSYYAYHQIIHFNTSDAQPNVLVRDLRRFMIPTPPYEEQKEIASVIIKELNTLNTIISKYQKQIDLMQEYRTSLISQAVTGKIDVREWQPKMQEYSR